MLRFAGSVSNDTSVVEGGTKIYWWTVVDVTTMVFPAYDGGNVVIIGVIQSDEATAVLVLLGTLMVAVVPKGKQMDMTLMTITTTISIISGRVIASERGVAIGIASASSTSVAVVVY
jgi:hypothetical protein